MARLRTVCSMCVWIGVLLLSSTHSLGSEQLTDDKKEADGIALKYDGRVGPIRVGKLEAILTVENGAYELDGSIVGAGPIKRLLKWQGEFNAKGILEEGRPVTKSYLLTESEKRGDEIELKTVSIQDSIALITETGKPDLEQPAPGGIDMMSAILVNSECRENMVVHDGEDPFVIQLKQPGEPRKLRQGRKYYSGETEMCRYEFIYDEDEVRKVDIWLADVRGRKVPVRIRIRIPVIPDGVFKLRLQPTDTEESESSS